MFVHFGPAASNIQNGTFTPLSRGYWKCIWFEMKFLLLRLFDTPVIGLHYIPHLVALGNPGNNSIFSFTSYYCEVTSRYPLRWPYR